jgi:TolB-like protein
MSLFDELKRRNVFRVGVAYIVASWVILQVADLVLEGINSPDWVLQVMMFLIALGFFAAVIIAWAYEMTPEGIKREKDIEPDASVTAVTSKKLDKITIGLLVVVLAIFAVDRFVLERPTKIGPDTFSQSSVSDTTEVDEKMYPAPIKKEASSDGRQSVAVLPFVNMSDDAQNEYFSDGISEELLNVLVKIKSLRVPSRTSSFTFKGSKLKLSDIGKELGVDHVLEGSVRKAGNQIRVTAQLIDVQSDTHLWSDTYTRELDDIFAVQDEISQAIVQALQVTLSGADQKQLTDHGTENAEAYNLYLLGRHQWNSRVTQALIDSTVPLLEAVQLDPEFDRAWAALADAYVLMPEYGAGDIDESIANANDAIGKALAINPNSARAMTSRGYVKSMYEYDIEGALADFERAIEIDPSYPTAHQWYGEILAVALRLDEGLAQVRIAIDLDPLAPILHHVAGWLHHWSGNPADAFPYYESALAINPRMRGTHGNLASLYTMLGDYEPARSQLDIAASIMGFDPAADHAAIDALEDPAKTDRAVELLLNTEGRQQGVMGDSAYFMLLDRPELALQSLETGMATEDPYNIHMNRVRLFDPLRDDPRFQAMLRKMNLLP